MFASPERSAATGQGFAPFGVIFQLLLRLNDYNALECLAAMSKEDMYVRECMRLWCRQQRKAMASKKILYRSETRVSAPGPLRGVYVRQNPARHSLTTCHPEMPVKRAAAFIRPRVGLRDLLRYPS